MCIVYYSKPFFDVHSFGSANHASFSVAPFAMLGLAFCFYLFISSAFVHGLMRMLVEGLVAATYDKDVQTRKQVKSAR